jgi:hypothetical protein
MLPDRVFVPALTGTEGNVYFNLYLHQQVGLAVLCLARGVALVTACMLNASVYLRLFVAYCAVSLAASLASPIGSAKLSQWASSSASRWATATSCCPQRDSWRSSSGLSLVSGGRPYVG